MEQMLSNGWVEVITGPMFAGKSEELIRRVKRLDYAHKKYCAFKPRIDDRYSSHEIVSHSLRKTPSFVIEKAKEIEQYLPEDVDCIIIDEVQFLDDEIVNVCENLASRGIRVIVAGLDMDFRGEPFPIMAKLLAVAEYVTKLTAICVCCGSLATRTQRLINGVPASRRSPTVLIGATECYEARCRRCHEVKE